MNTRFGVGDISQADPRLQIAAGLSQGYDDCEKENLVGKLLSVPFDDAVSKSKQLAQLAQVCSVALDVRQANEFGKAIADLQQPGELLYDTSRKVGRLLCEGASLKDVLERRLPIQREVSTAGPAPKSRHSRGRRAAKQMEIQDELPGTAAALAARYYAGG